MSDESLEQEQKDTEEVLQEKTEDTSSLELEEKNPEKENKESSSVAPKKNIISELFGQGASLITLAGSQQLSIDDDTRRLVALFSDGTYLVTRLLTPNVVEFIKSFIITILIEAFTFDANLKYFTSEKHKQELNDNIEYLNKTIEINKYDVYTFNRFSELYLKELTYEVRKLSEITNYNSEEVAVEQEEVV